MVGDWPLVGREDELAFALDALANAVAGGLVLAGMAGVGKSRLASEVFAALGHTGSRVIACAATKATASIPFGAVAALVPELDASVDDRLGVFQAVVTELARASDAGPVVISLDDAHLADDATAALLHHLVTRRLARVVLTIRTGEPVPDAVTALWKDGHCARLDVQALARDEVDELIGAALGGPVERQTLDRMWTLSHGNPLLLRELVLHAVENGSMATHLGFWRWRGEVNPSSRLIDIVGLRLGQLSAPDREAVALLAYGEPLGAVMLEQMVGDWTTASLADRGVIRIELDRRRRNVVLGHPLYGEVVRAETSADEVARLMQRLAGEVQRRSARRSGDASQLARWGIESGTSIDADIILRAAREAYRASDFALAERLARADPDWPTHETGYILGAALAAQEHNEAADEVLIAAAIAPPTDELRARIAYQRMELLFHPLSRHFEAAEVFAAAMGEVIDPAWRDVLKVGWAPSLVAMGRHEEAMALLEPMADATEPRTRLAAVRGLSYVLVPAGQTTRVVTMCDDLLSSAFELRAEWEWGLFDVFAARITALLMEGRLDEAERMLQLGEATIDPERDQSTFSFINVGRGRLALFRGAPISAARSLREALAGFSRLDLGVRGSWTFRLLAEALALVGDVPGAQHALADAVANAGPLQDPFGPDGVRAASWAAAGAGEVDRARNALLGEAAAARERGQFGYETLILHDAARLGGAADVAGRLAELAALVDGPMAAAYADHAAALSAGDGAGLDDASVRFAEQGFALLAAEASAEASAALRATGLVARASAAAARATSLRDRCEGAATPALTADAGVDLTRREREVATMAARGQTSKEIATTMHVSSRTVENHLQRAYEKLGVRRRDELAAALGLETE